MSGVNGDRCGRKARNTHCPEVQQVLRLGSQKRGVRGRAWACAARGILAADSAGSRGHGACHTRTRGFLRHLIDRRFKRYCRRGLEDITGGEPLMIIGNICAVCSITTKCQQPQSTLMGISMHTHRSLDMINEIFLNREIACFQNRWRQKQFCHKMGILPHPCCIIVVSLSFMLDK